MKDTSMHPWASGLLRTSMIAHDEWMMLQNVARKFYPQQGQLRETK